MEAQELEDRIAAFPRWNYQFEFEGGVKTPISDRGQLNRHQQRRRYFFDALVALMGGSLRGRRVLDLGCNAGFWSLAAIEAGADFVLGVDARDVFIDQAGLVFDAKQIDPGRYRFEVGNVFEHDFPESFDIVLCLGVMDVTCKPVELFELMSGVGGEVIVIDTTISRVRSSYFEVSTLNDRRNAVEAELVLLPSRQAVTELAAQFGFQAVPLAYNITDYTGMDDYRRMRRLAFVCARGGVSLESLPRAREPSAAPWWLHSVDRRSLRRARS